MGGMIPMMGDACFQQLRVEGEAACKLIPNQGLHPAAMAFAVAHPRAIQYLEQAPVLVFGGRAGGAGVRRVNVLFMQHKLTPLCERGAKLSEVMRAFDLQPVMRRLAGSALFPGAHDVIFALAKMNSAELGNLIPVRRGAQRAWLSNLADFRERMTRRCRKPDQHFAWAARELGRHKVGRGEATDMGDFASQEGAGFSDAWQWPRAVEEMARWHAQITVSKALNGLPIQPDTIIDLGPHPDTWDVDDYRFVALRTPTEIVAEGALMHHCVGSYLKTVLDGACHIVSVRRGEEHVATLEVRKGKVEQLKGRFNAVPSQTVRALAQTYVTLWSTWAEGR